MTIQVLDIQRGPGMVHATLATDTKQAYICIADGYVNVLCKNASHKAYRGTGRVFSNIFEAKAAYKSSDMKAMIDYAATFTNQEQPQ